MDTHACASASTYWFILRVLNELPKPTHHHSLSACFPDPRPLQSLSLPPTRNAWKGDGENTRVLETPSLAYCSPTTTCSKRTCGPCVALRFPSRPPFLFSFSLWKFRNEKLTTFAFPSTRRACLGLYLPSLPLLPQTPRPRLPPLLSLRDRS